MHTHIYRRTFAIVNGERLFNWTVRQVICITLCACAPRPTLVLIEICKVSNALLPPRLPKLCYPLLAYVCMCACVYACKSTAIRSFAIIYANDIGKRSVCHHCFARTISLVLQHPRFYAVCFLILYAHFSNVFTHLVVVFFFDKLFRQCQCLTPLALFNVCASMNYANSCVFPKPHSLHLR